MKLKHYIKWNKQNNEGTIMVLFHLHEIFRVWEFIQIGSKFKDTRNWGEGIKEYLRF